uniref:Uncharacterized protein n=1 Tax=viral metagenome TaxID=1070528 RepID=A0A6C0I4I3_9ZZZZ
MEHQKGDREQELKDYFESMSEKERKAYEIAKDHLGMSYQVEKSIAFIAYCKKRKDASLLLVSSK